ncbi:MAG TPA: hypothetical protein VGG72_05655 [Bryobacteraceae bacterium]|jgi:hypothetical protein
MMKKNFFTIFSVLGALAISPIAHATLLAPNLAPGGDFVGSPPTSTAPGSATKLASDTVAFSTVFGSALSGTLYQAVYEEATTNTLDFYYQVTITSTSNGASLTQLSISDFSYWPIAVGTANTFNLVSGKTAKGSIAPSNGGSPSVERSSGPSGGSIDFFYTGLTKNLTTYTLFVSTPETGPLWNAKGNAIVDTTDLSHTLGIGGITGIYTPDADPVPEPVSIILGGSVLSLSAFWLRRRRRNAAKA